jgi:putative acetyltransferase
MLTFTPETDDDIATIRSLVTAAFGRTSEADLIEAIRASPNFIPELSLVAAEDGNVLGHILFSPIVIESQGGTVPALALAPLAVTPPRQHQGIGTQLVQAGLSKCRELDHGIVVVLGEPHYYGRFGFQTASQFGIQAPFPVPEQVFMVLELKPGALINVSGIVRYPAYFDEV